ncbi:MAG: sodium/proton-translocating pyrophosphatase, partial [Vicinamibacterales bacterium]
MSATVQNVIRRVFILMLLAGFVSAVPVTAVAAQPDTAATQSEPVAHGGEANLTLPDLSSVTFQGVDGHTLLMSGILICGLGLLFGLVTFKQLRDLPVHPSMREVSELIYATCQTYLVTQGKFILLLEVFIGAIMVFYFGFLLHMEAFRVVVILLFSLIGIAGSYGVAWFGIRVNTFANSRAAFASLRGKPFPIYAIPLRAGMSIGMLLISVELLLMLGIL